LLLPNPSHVPVCSFFCGPQLILRHVHDLDGNDDDSLDCRVTELGLHVCVDRFSKLFTRSTAEERQSEETVASIQRGVRGHDVYQEWERRLQVVLVRGSIQFSFLCCGMTDINWTAYGSNPVHHSPNTVARPTRLKTNSGDNDGVICALSTDGRGRDTVGEYRFVSEDRGCAVVRCVEELGSEVVRADSWRVLHRSFMILGLSRFRHGKVENITLLLSVATSNVAYCWNIKPNNVQPIQCHNPFLHIGSCLHSLGAS
jgi:hypothetical protein